MKVLTVRDLRKTYKSFTLKDVSFSLEAGGITGFIGRNGAGKTTTLKSLLNFVHPDAGEIRFFGTSFSENELRIKQRIGYASGGVDYYPKKKIRLITEVTKRLAIFDNLC
ncbi:MAG: ATP-binding cassette domain-containing protein [Rectinemataceae bacterium]